MSNIKPDHLMADYLNEVLFSVLMEHLGLFSYLIEISGGKTS